MVKVKGLVDIILDKMSLMQALPGQGVFGAEQCCESDFSVPIHNTDADTERAADAVIEEYSDKLETMYLGMLEKTKFDAAVFDAKGIALLNAAVHSRCDVLVNEDTIKAMEECGEFRAGRAKRIVGGTKYVGRLGWAKVYANQCVKHADAYVMDRTVLDVKYDVKKTGDGGAELKVTVKTGAAGVTRYLLAN